MKNKSNFVWNFIVVFAVTYLPQWLSKEKSAEMLVKETSLLEIYQQGGSLMHLISLCSIGTFAVCVYCFIQISAKKMNPKSLYETLLKYMQERNVPAAYDLCRVQSPTLAKILAAALVKADFSRDLSNKTSMEAAAVEVLDYEEHRHMLWVNYLNIFATIAPMIGLLGTVTGMISSFDSLKRGMVQPTDLAGGIGEAMTCTAGGLFVGVPAMFFYFFFRDKLQTVLGDVQRQAGFLLDVLSGEIKLEAAPIPVMNHGGEVKVTPPLV
jgi:biopolymer transport protein ExbB